MKRGKCSLRHDTRAALEFIFLEAAQNIADDTAGATFVTFLNDRRMRQLVERTFEVIGEAVNRLIRHDPLVAAEISERRLIVDFRNAIVHGYDTIDYRRVWSAVVDSLPALHAEVVTLLAAADVDRPKSDE